MGTLVIGLGNHAQAQTSNLNPHSSTLNPQTEWYNRTQQIDNVEVLAKRSRYSRKDNPAVELMKRVVEGKQRADLNNRDYYQYHQYRKITLALNEITPAFFESPKLRKPSSKGGTRGDWLLNQVEVCPYNNKLILPVMVEENVSQTLYRKQPHSEKVIIRGKNQTGINDLLQTGDMLNMLMNDVFTDVNIYEDQIWLLRHHFTSPISRGALAFYRYYIEDTLYVGRDKCIHLSFLPNNQQDYGFRGELYVMADSSYQVRRCDMTLPQQSDVNFVESMRIVQQFQQLPDSTWVLSNDDMFTELALVSSLQKFAVIRSSQFSDYAFDMLPDRLFRGKKKEVTDINAMMRDDDFWNQYRPVGLTKAESSMGQFLHGLERVKGFKYILWLVKAFIEDYIETSTNKDCPSKVDIGPVSTFVTNNYVDGIRLRLSAQTTANHDSNLFLSGYVARGLDSHKTYYRGDIIWSFNKKDYLPHEFPKRTLTFSSTYDVMSPSDKFLHTDKDNVFTAFKWTTVDRMMFYNRQSLTFEREEDWGFRTTLSLKTEKNEAAGNLYFVPVSIPIGDMGSSPVGKDGFRTTELHAELRYAPGETYIHTKQQRIPLNLNAPVFTLSHTWGMKGVLGGEYNYNLTEASIFKRFWLNSWGKVDCMVKGGIQWNKVPFPLLIMPETNLSYIIQDYTFELINDMEFLNDRYASAIVSWDMGGKLLNRIPLIRKLKWREMLAVRCLWGDLTDKNNPTLATSSPRGGNDESLLMAFPESSHVMQPDKPYWEVAAGIHNILKVLHVEYVRRLNYNHLPTAHKHGIRFTLRLKF